MENHVAAVHALGKDDAIFVVAGQARPMSLIALRCQQVIGRDQADARSSWRIAGVGNCVTPFIDEPGNACVLDAPFLVRRRAVDGGTVPHFVDRTAVMGDRERKS